MCDNSHLEQLKVEEIKQMTGTKSRGHGRVAFIAHRENIKTLLEAGHSLRTVYEDHKEQLGIGYPQFTKYVGRFIESEEHQKGEVPARHEPTSGSTNNPAARTETRPKPKGFSHDPNSGNRNDLI